MNFSEALIDQIQRAFASAKYPGDQRLTGSTEGTEPLEVARDFGGKVDWRALSPKFIDLSPDGLASSLSFFSDEAFCFFLPAYLIADINRQLERSNPVFHLTHGLDRRSARQRINPRRYGEETWNDYARKRFAVFTREQCAAIVSYLEFKRDVEGQLGGSYHEISEALDGYWIERAI